MRFGIFLLCLGLVACGGAEPPTSPAAPTAQPSTAATAAPPVAAVGAPAETFEQLLVRANAAFGANRLVAPPGDNALELFLAARDLRPDNSSAQEALVELFPPTASAVESALARNDMVEASRLLGLLDRAMPNSLSAQKLRQQLTLREQKVTAAAKNKEEADARKAAAASLAAANASTAPATTPTVVRTPIPAPATAAAVPPTRTTTTATANPAATATVAATTAPTPTTKPAPLPTPAAPVPSAPPAPSPAASDAIEPVVLTRATPDYPPTARQRNLQGWVELEFTVGLNGRASDIKVTGSQPKGVFDMAAQRALTRWRFTPGQRAGVAVAMRTRTRMSFKLN